MHFIAFRLERAKRGWEMSTRPVHQILEDLAQTIAARKQLLEKGESVPASYVAKLFAKGDDAILKKIGEEAAEVVMAAKDCRYALLDQQFDPSKQALLVGELADLWFHTLILLAQFELGPEDVLQELKRREGVSGEVEKASRTQLK
jgi:phosphoribosyl-ATP pyrophosphohydrolase